MITPSSMRRAVLPSARPAMSSVAVIGPGPASSGMASGNAARYWAVLRANAQLGDGNRERDTDTNHADDPSKAVGEGDTHVVPEKNRPQAHGEMADDEQRGEGIMGNESNVPRIMQ